MCAKPKNEEIKHGISEGNETNEVEVENKTQKTKMPSAPSEYGHFLSFPETRGILEILCCLLDLSSGRFLSE